MLWPRWQPLAAMAFALFSFPGSGQALAQGAPALPAQVSGQPPQQVLFDLEALLARTLAPGLHQYAFYYEIKPPFEMYDTDHDGAITSADRQRNRQRFEAMHRAQQISLMLQTDLNSDGIITAEELAIFARYQSRFARGEGPEADARRAETARRIVEARMRGDTNGDGKIDWNEIFAYARKFPTPSPVDFDGPYRGFLSLDADGDGKTTFKEYTDAMERRFAEYDSDGNGLISRAEFDAYWQRSGKEAPKVAEIQPNHQIKDAIECTVPRPGRDVDNAQLDHVALLGAADVDRAGADVHARVHPIAVDQNSQTHASLKLIVAPPILRRRLTKPTDHTTLAYCLSNARSNFEKPGHCLSNRSLPGEARTSHAYERQSPSGLRAGTVVIDGDGEIAVVALERGRLDGDDRKAAEGEDRLVAVDVRPA